MADYSEELDKITERELCPVLREKITLSYSHLNNTSMHVTSDERNLWNETANMPDATTTKAGKMSIADKKKLDGIDEGANAYTHPKSGAVYGTYIQVTVNEYGHVISGTNPEKLNISVKNADTVGGYKPDSFLPSTSPVLKGTPECPTPSGDDLYQVVNVNYLVKQLKELEETIMEQVEQIAQKKTLL